MLREYWKTHRNPLWLFPALGRDRQQGATATQPMPIDTVQGAFRQVVKELGLRKRVSVHTLRHSYATHLLESGVNVRLIQQYLGHAFLNSVMVYLHLTNTGQQEAYGVINALMANGKEAHHDHAR
jgi:integrase